MNAPAWTWGLLLALLAVACERVLPDVTWDRMINQRRGKPYAASAYFPDGKLMQAPPQGTVPASAEPGRRRVLEGIQNNEYVTAIPVPIDRAFMRAGRKRFDTYCAVCHGIDGSGESVVAHNMTMRRPPSLVVDPVRSFPPGRVFQVISAGYGLMPSYAQVLSLEDRWAVIAYLRALQRSRAVQLASLPPDVRRRVDKELP